VNLLKNNSHLPTFFLYLIFLGIALGASWGSNYFVVDHITFKSNIVLPIILISSLFYIFYEFKNRQTKLTFTYSQLAISFLLIYSSFSFFWAEDKWIFFDKWLLFISGVFVFFLLSKLEIKKNTEFKIASLFVICSFLVAIIGITQFLFSFPSWDILQFNNNTASTFGNKNAANQFIVFTFPFFFYLLIQTYSSLSRYLTAIAFTAILFYMFYSTTKGAWIAVSIQLIIILCLYIYKYRLQAKSLNTKLILSFVLSFLFFVSVQNFSTSFSNEKNTGLERITSSLESIQERYKNVDSPRWTIWKTIPTLIEDSPVIGYGLGNYTAVSSQQGIHQKLQRVHNDLFELVLELGILGLIVFLLFVIYLVKDLVTINKLDQDRSFFYNLAFLSIIGSSMHMMVSWPYQTMHGILSAALIFGLISQKAKALTNKGCVVLTLPKIFLTSLNLFILFFTLLGIYKVNIWTNGLSDFYENSGTQGSKYDNKKLLNASKNMLRKDLKINAIASEYYDKGYEERAIDIYRLASSNNMLANFRQVLFLIDGPKPVTQQINEAKTIIDEMKEVSINHPLTFSARMLYMKATKNISEAKKIYQETKKYIESKLFPDSRFYLYLHQWSITLQFYEDTPKFYKELIDGNKLQPYIENKMINYYVYINQHEKALPHLKFVIENKPDIVNPIVLRALVDKGLVRISNESQVKQ